MSATLSSRAFIRFSWAPISLNVSKSHSTLTKGGRTNDNLPCKVVHRYKQASHSEPKEARDAQEFIQEDRPDDDLNRGI